MTEVAREEVSVRLVLVSTDIEIIETLCRIAQALNMHIEPCCDVETAMRKLCHQKFEGVVVDLANEGGSELLKKIRTLTSNKSVLCFAILKQEHKKSDSFFSSANFVLQRPIQSAAVFRVLKASYPMMVREKRRYFRYPVQISVFVARNSGEEFVVPSLNISEGGICLNSSVAMQVGDQLRLRLQLPGESESLTLNGEVCWSEALGRVGIQFVGLASKVSEALQNWLAERLEQSLSHDHVLGTLAPAGGR